MNTSLTTESKHTSRRSSGASQSGSSVSTGLARPADIKLRLNEVSHAYGDGESELTVLDGLSCTVRAGELVAVVGPSGSGKSTFLSIAGALLTPSRGEAEVGGRNLAGLNPQKLADLRLHEIGFIFQGANLLPYLRVEEQLRFVAKLGHADKRQAVRRAEELLERLGLTSRRRHYPDKLSGGERQRVAVARALMNDPSVILADEPTASLDADRGRDVTRLLAERVKAEGKAGVIVTHDERILPYCDRVLRLEGGRLREG
ncbi:ABC transporter ATP-binding protein [Saccharibacillus alkalitolerans]|uniref:Putative hemin import ATP-binding protein HrtA n=1 Tax=Saccharibacillus alkalitolerans TaxID=2705290 RepID=A0ABX0F3C1_9BACL|nr:ABC transporter ATP-binding protein [Saccharibacillus alkalitolerans]NGZ74370.1 ABC transporter ATP-binding protein [Saccharibacillus alkalitolerans]